MEMRLSEGSTNLNVVSGTHSVWKNAYCTRYLQGVLANITVDLQSVQDNYPLITPPQAFDFQDLECSAKLSSEKVNETFTGLLTEPAGEHGICSPIDPNYCTLPFGSSVRTTL